MTHQTSARLVANNDPLQSNDMADEFENFIYILSHDVRSSVRALLELPQWLQEDLIEAGHKIDGPLAENFELMGIHMRRLDRMLVDLLEFSRVGRKQTLQMMNVSRTLDMVVAKLDPPTGFMISRDLQCDSVRMGDKDLSALLSALISNAVKHHDEITGHIAIGTRRDGVEVVLTIRDDGPGIPEAQREVVFEAMKTLRPRDEVEGSGMGLATVRKILTHYGGRLAFLPDPEGGGLAMELRFPG